MVEVSRRSNFGFTHKLTKRHLEFEDRKMHVRTAVETLSGSVANSMEFLMKNGVAEFAGAEATIEMVRIFNNLWDIMNTQRVRGDLSNAFKSALNRNNADEVFGMMDKAKEYILSLTVKDPKSNRIVRIVDSRWNTGFRGFVVDIISVKAMYMEFVHEKCWIICLRTYRISQDPLEIYFGDIRNLNGHNDNPTAVQFLSAYRKLLFNHDIPHSKYSNVRIEVSTNLLNIPSSTRRSNLMKDVAEYDAILQNAALTSEQEEDEEWVEALEWDQLVQSDYLNGGTIDSGIAYTANIIEKRLRDCDHVYCTYYMNTVVLHENQKVNDEACLATINGKPCLSTYQLCKLTDIALENYINMGQTMKKRVYLDVVNNINFKNLFKIFFEPDHDIDHKHFIIKFIIDEYINKKCAFVAKQHTRNLQKKYLRNKLRKTCHLMHQ